MNAPTYHIIAPASYLLPAAGLKALLLNYSAANISLFAPEKWNPTPTATALFIFDEAYPLDKLLEKNYGGKVILIYTSNIPLRSSHFRKLPLEVEGLWHFEDLTPTALKDYMHLINTGNTAHSQRINHCLRRAFQLDDFDLRLLEEMSKGLHTQEIAEKLGSSKSTIERHKRRLKEDLGIDAQTDCGLLVKLHSLGYICL